MPGPLDAMNVKIGADLSGLYKGAADASKVLSDVGASAAQVAPSLSKAAAAADALEVSLSDLAAKGNANIKAIADRALGISPLITNISKNVAAFGGGVLTNKVPEYFKKVEDEAIKAGNALGSNVKPGSDRAAFALQNLGRIAQDAPFGFIGISNNINPMLESFERLKAETGSTSSALKAMVSGLTGAGGLGLAVSVATSVLTVLALNGFFKTEKAADDAKKKIDGYKEALNNIYSDSAKEATTVQSLIAVLQNETETRKRKLDAIKELQNINPEVFSGLKMEGTLVTGLEGAYKNYIDNIKTVIAAKIKQHQLEDITQKILEKEGATLTGNALALKNAVDKVNQARRSGNKDAIDPLTLKQDQEKAKDQLYLNSLYGEQKKLIGDLTTLSGGIKVDIVKDPKDKAHIKDVDDVLKQLNADLEFNQKLADIGFISSGEEDIAKIAKVKGAIEELLKLPKGKAVAPGSPIIEALLGRINPEETRVQLGERMKEISKTISTVSQTDIYKASDTIAVNIPIRLKPGNIKAAMADIDKQFIEEFNKTAKDIQKGILTGGLADLGQTIGDALGGGDVRGAFQGLLQTVINGMKQLGEAMIALGTAKIALEKFNLAPGIGTVLAGVGVIALSSLIQSALPKFAGGVTGFGGGMAIVGERGPEMVRLPSGSDVIPNHRLNGITGGGVQVFIPNLVFRGSDMLVQFNRAQQQQNRRG